MKEHIVISKYIKIILTIGLLFSIYACKYDKIIVILGICATLFAISIFCKNNLLSNIFFFSALLSFFTFTFINIKQDLYVDILNFINIIIDTCCIYWNYKDLCAENTDKFIKSYPKA